MALFPDATAIGVVALLLRAVLGTLYIPHGRPKLFGPSRQQTIDWLKSMKIPGIFATLVGLLEFFGGIALIIGFLTPIVAALLVLEMVGTIALNMKMGKKLIGGYELDISYLAIALALVILGGGPFSADVMIGPALGLPFR